MTGDRGVEQEADGAPRGHRRRGRRGRQRRRCKRDGRPVASTCRARGLDVTVVDVFESLLHRRLGEQLGAVVTDLHHHAGVQRRRGVGVRSCYPHDDGVRLLLEDGHTLDADAAEVGIGTTTRTDWLADATCHAAGVEDAVVAGDVARWPNLLFDRTPRLVKHWINALEMGRHVADSPLAGRAAARPFTPIPRFWSEQHGVKIQFVGLPTLPGCRLTVVGGKERDRRLVAVSTMSKVSGKAAAVAPCPGADWLMGVTASDNTRLRWDYAPLVGRAVTFAE